MTPHCVYNWLTDVIEGVSVTHRRRSTPEKLFFCFWYVFLDDAPQHGASSGCGWRDDLQQLEVSSNALNKQSLTNDEGWYSSLGLGVGLNTHHRYNRVSNLDGFLNKRSKRRNTDMRLGTWNVRSVYRAGSLMTLSRNLSRYRLVRFSGSAGRQMEASGNEPVG
jgi:hypothetical protein